MSYLLKNSGRVGQVAIPQRSKKEMNGGGGGGGTSGWPLCKGAC